jgi:SHS2 domain-containing protein
MPYRYLEDVATADVAFEAKGETVEEMFISAAHAVTGAMVERLDAVEGKEGVCIRVEEHNLEMLLFDFLQEIIYYKDARRLLLVVEELDIDRNATPMTLSALTKGETLDPERHPLLTDVKAVTMHRFSVEQTDDAWKATVVLDI